MSNTTTKLPGSIRRAALKSQGVVETLATFEDLLAKAVTRAREAEQLVEALAENPPVGIPAEFTGFARNYRFVPGDPPRHCFEVEIPGEGLWLAVNVGSDKFDEFLSTTDMSDFRGAISLNDQEITVRRDPGYGQIVPVCLGRPSITFADLDTGGRQPLGFGKDGRPIFKNDLILFKPVRQSDYLGRDRARLTYATALDFDGEKWTILQRGQKTPKTFTVAEIARFRRFEAA